MFCACFSETCSVVNRFKLKYGLFKNASTLTISSSFRVVGAPVGITRRKSLSRDNCIERRTSFDGLVPGTGLGRTRILASHHVTHARERIITILRRPVTDYGQEHISAHWIQVYDWLPVFLFAFLCIFIMFAFAVVCVCVHVFVCVATRSSGLELAFSHYPIHMRRSSSPELITAEWQKRNCTHTHLRDLAITGIKCNTTFSMI